MVQRFVAVMQILAIVEVHDERFAGTGCHPEGEFLNVFWCERGILGIAGGFFGVARFDEGVELGEELRRAVGFPIQENLGIEHGEVLEIAEGDRRGACPVDCREVPLDVGIVSGQPFVHRRSCFCARHEVDADGGESICVEAFFLAFLPRRGVRGWFDTRIGR